MRKLRPQFSKLIGQQRLILRPPTQNVQKQIAAQLLLSTFHECGEFLVGGADLVDIGTDAAIDGGAFDGGRAGIVDRRFGKAVCQTDDGTADAAGENCRDQHDQHQQDQNQQQRKAADRLQTGIIFACRNDTHIPQTVGTGEGLHLIIGASDAAAVDLAVVKQRQAVSLRKGRADWCACGIKNADVTLSFQKTVVQQRFCQ